MANNLTQGVIQVFDNSVESINHALLRILEQLDSLRGLRGRTDLYDQTTVSPPQQMNAAVRLDNLSALVSDISDPFAAIRMSNGQSNTILEEEVLAFLRLPPFYRVAQPAVVPSGATLQALQTFGGVETMDIYQLFLTLKDTGVAQ